MQRSDLSIGENIPLLDDLDVAERGMVIIDTNNISHAKSLIVRLEECIHLLSTQKSLYDNIDIIIHNSTVFFYRAATMLSILTPAIIEAIIIFTMLSLSIDTFSSEIYDGPYCPTNSDCLNPKCDTNYPISNFSSPWPYALPENKYNDSTLFACYNLYNENISDAKASRGLAIIFLSLANAMISLSVALMACLTLATLPKRKPLFSDRTTLMMLSEKMQQEINYLATQTRTIITDCSSINQLIEAFRPALEDRQRARQRRAFLSGSLRKNENSPLYRFFNGQTVNDKFVRGDGDTATTERIFKYAGLLK